LGIETIKKISADEFLRQADEIQLIRKAATQPPTDPKAL